MASRDDIKRLGKTLEAEPRNGEPKDGWLGEDVLLSAISAAELTSYAARRRAKLSNLSVNIELEHLRAVMRRARKLWNVAVAEIDWQALLLEEAGEREHILGRDDRWVGSWKSGRRIGEHLLAAIEEARLCSNDPVCAEHDASAEHDPMHLHGAACHGCLLIAETSCEQRNDWLDPALVVATLAVTDAAFFS